MKSKIARRKIEADREGKGVPEEEAEEVGFCLERRLERRFFFFSFSPLLLSKPSTTDGSVAALIVAPREKNYQEIENE